MSLNAWVNAQEQQCVVLSVSGDIQVRQANQLDWQPVNEGFTLNVRETIRGVTGSSARISTFEDRVFVLLGSSQIEVRELQKLNRDDVVMELTALEMQKLPVKMESPNNRQSAFVLHGSLPSEMEKSKVDKPKAEYIQLEKQGAISLFEQGFIGGYIIKWNRLVSLFPNIRSEKEEAALIKAYQEMKMPFRMRQAIQRFKARWPDSKFYP